MVFSYHYFVFDLGVSRVIVGRWYSRAALQIEGGDDASATTTAGTALAAPSSSSAFSPTTNRARFVKVIHTVMAVNRFKASLKASAAAQSPAPKPARHEPPPRPPSPPPYLTQKDFENEDAYKRYVKRELRIGMRARVARGASYGQVGDIVTFARDDGTYSPLFRWSNGEEAYLTVSKVELIRDEDDKSTVIANHEMKPCSACTFLNAGHLSKCEMCGTALPKEGVVFSTTSSEDRWLRVTGAGNNDVNGLWAIDCNDPFVNGRPEFKKVKDDGTLDFEKIDNTGVDKLRWSGPKFGWTFVGTSYRI